MILLTDVDQKLLRTLQLSQYSVQYLLGCQTAMKSNKKMINESLKVFDREEALLDLRLAKMRLAVSYGLHGICYKIMTSL